MPSGTAKMIPKTCLKRSFFRVNSSVCKKVKFTDSP